VGVWEAVWSQAATEAAEGEGWWSGEGRRGERGRDEVARSECCDAG
jgi:hypothetical protein